jgi:hypothetical protein
VNRLLTQVLENNNAQQQFLIHWYHPSARSLERTTVYHQHCFQEENVEVHVRNRQRGARGVRLEPRTQFIGYDTVHFGFNKLRSSGALPAEVVIQSLSHSYTFFPNIHLYFIFQDNICHNIFEIVKNCIKILSFTLLGPEAVAQRRFCNWASKTCIGIS